MSQFKLAIVVPCYNEFDRLPVDEFKDFLTRQKDVQICFVNDASTDRTLEKLEQLAMLFPEQIRVVSNPENKGKAASVRNGALKCHQDNNAAFLGYLDADLATSLEECYSLLSEFKGEISFVFASRILKLGSVVDRKFSRFFFGRIIATFISSILDLKVYDTQCGCKVFKSEIALILFENPFHSKWLFDVELFSRMLCAYGKDNALQKMMEVPVKRWVDQGDSKVKLTYFFRLWYDLYLIGKEHRSNYRYRKTAYNP